MRSPGWPTNRSRAGPDDNVALWILAFKYALQGKKEKALDG